MYDEELVKAGQIGDAALAPEPATILAGSRGTDHARKRKRADLVGLEGGNMVEKRLEEQISM